MATISEVGLGAVATAGLTALTLFSGSDAKAEMLSGPYVGVQGGLEQFSKPVGDGPTYGGFAGANVYLTDKILVGVEGSYNKSSAQGEQVINPYVKADVQAQNHYDVMGKVGYDLGPVIVYGGGGVMQTKIKTTVLGQESHMPTPLMPVGMVGVDVPLSESVSVGVVGKYGRLNVGEKKVEHKSVQGRLTLNF